MAGSLNKVMLIGNLGRDPEVRSLNSGEKVANLALATGESWTDKATGERKERTEWHRIAVFNDRLVDVIEKYCRKGSKLYVEGQLQTRKYTDNAGVERYQTEVVLSKFRGELTLLDSRNAGAGEETPPTRPAPTPRAPARGKTEYAGGGSDLEDSIPF